MLLGLFLNWIKNKTTKKNLLLDTYQILVRNSMQTKLKVILF